MDDIEQAILKQVSSLISASEEFSLVNWDTDSLKNQVKIAEETVETLEYWVSQINSAVSRLDSKGLFNDEY